MSLEETPTATLLPHPLAGGIPAMSDHEFLELRISIRTHGLLPGGEIVLHDGLILDGRERYRACLAEGVEPRFLEYTGDDPHGYVQAAITRRNMGQDRKALFIAGMLRQQAEMNTERWTEAELCRRFGIGSAIVAEAGRVLRYGIPRLRRMVENGKATIRHAEKVARLPVREQERVVDTGPYSVKSKAWQIIKGSLELPDPPEHAPEPASRCEKPQ